MKYFPLPFNARPAPINALRGAVLLALTLMALPDIAARAQETTPGEASTWELSEHASYSLRILTFGVYQDPAESTQNPGNGFLRLPTYRMETEIRPDIALDLDRLHLSAKPRMRIGYQGWREGALEGRSEWDEEVFVNEWLFRFRVSDVLFVSYGRENLQWGPSYLLSPSNPFFRENGRRNPKQEIPGMDFVRVVWMPDTSWTLSFIANTEEGRQPVSSEPFRRTYALKLDYTGRESYGSLLLSHREGDRNRLGFFAGRTLTDALLLYGEGVISRGTGALYPCADQGPLGGSLQTLREEGASLAPTILLGGAYTLQAGPTLTMEYVYNSPGYNDGEAELFCRIRGRAAEALGETGPIASQAAGTLARTLDTGLRLLRRHYLMLQFNHNDIRDFLNLTFRWTWNLEDRSGQFTSIAECFLGNHLSLFSVGTVNTGGGDTEFGSILDLQWILGLEVVF